MTNEQWLNDLNEKYFHSDTMHMTPLEIQWRKDANQHLESLSSEERKAWLAAEYNS